MVATMRNQTADIESGLFLFVATHGAVTLFDMPANGAFGGVIGAI